MGKTESRKLDHIRLCLEKDTSFKKTAGFEDVELLHNALPDINYDDIDASCAFLGHKFSAPVFIEAMTGGTAHAEKINKNLAGAAEELGIGMGVGSQRAGLETPALVDTYRVRDVAPNIFLVGNIGAAQLVKNGPDIVAKCRDMIEADAVAVHLNAAQEAVQQDGDRKWRGAIGCIRKACDVNEFPIIAKETGCGISASVALKLEGAGIAAIDVAGAGGTCWVLIDALRSGGHVADGIMEWGIPTATSLLQCANAVKIPLIASGGVRSGVDVAKSLALGASIGGLALPFLKAANVSESAVKQEVERVINELKMTMFLVGATTIDKLKNAKVVVTGKTRELAECSSGRAV